MFTYHIENILKPLGGFIIKLHELSKSVYVFHDLDCFQDQRITYFILNMKIDVFLEPVVRVKFSIDFHGYLIRIKKGFICLMLLMEYLASLKHFWFWFSLHSS